MQKVWVLMSKSGSTNTAQYGKTPLTETYLYHMQSRIFNTNHVG